MLGAIIAISILVMATFGISVFCLHKYFQIKKIREIYEGYIIDLIEEVNRYKDEDFND